MNRILSLFMAIACLLPTGAMTAEPLRDGDIDITAPSAILMEKSTGEILYEKDAHRKIFPASVTKVMTMLLIVEDIEAGKISLEDTVTASERAASFGGSCVYLEEGEQMSVSDMLKCIAVVSANDCAVAMAEHLSGTEQVFVERMNKRAEELGLENTHFTGCTGLFDDGEHYTTAYDVAVMSRELIRHDLIKEYTTIWMDSLRGGEFGLANTNKMLKTYNGITGLKTGTTSKAGVCISASAERNGLRLIAVVLGASSGKERFESATALLDYGFANYENVTPQLPENAPETITVSHGTASEVELCYSTPQRFLMPKNTAEPLTATLELPQKLSAPVESGTLLGTVQLASGGEVLARFPVTAAQGVDALSFRYCFGRLVDSLLLYEGDFVQNK